MLEVFMLARVTQAEFGSAVGISQPAVSGLLASGVLPKDGTFGDWLTAYCHRLREQAAGRMGGEIGGLDLVQERAALAREQRISHQMKNQIARGEYAPIGLLADVLGMASSAVVGRMDQVEGTLKRTCPNLDSEVVTVVMQVLADARNEWVRATSNLISDRVEQMIEESEEEDEEAEADE